MRPRLITFGWAQEATLLFHAHWSRAALVTLFPMGRGRRTSGAQLHRGYVPTLGPTEFETEAEGRRISVQQLAPQVEPDSSREQKQVQGIHNLRARLRQQGTDQMEGAGLLFTARWHYSVPPHVQGPVFALERDQNSGEAREAGVRVNQWDISASPEQYRLRMGWWWLTPGQRVFGLVMGRHPACGDQTLYHVPPSRYTLSTVDWFQGPDRGSKTRFFDWLIELDGIGVDIRGGRYGVTRREWHVFSEEVAPYVSGGQAAAAVMAFHPDSPVWGVDVEAALAPPDPGIVRGQRAPVELRLAHHAGGRGASRVRSAVAWRQDTSAEAQATSGAVEAASRSQAPGDAGAAEAQD
jgi:hypothetical protein